MPSSITRRGLSHNLDDGSIHNEANSISGELSVDNVDSNDGVAADLGCKHFDSLECVHFSCLQFLCEWPLASFPGNTSPLSSEAELKSAQLHFRWKYATGSLRIPTTCQIVNLS